MLSPFGAVGVGTSSFPGFKAGMGVTVTEAGTGVHASHQQGVLLFPLETGRVWRRNVGTRQGVGSNCTLHGAVPRRETCPQARQDTALADEDTNILLST